MRNIFNHNQHTSLLKSSSRAKRGNLFTSIHSLYLAQGIRLTAYGVFVLLFIFVMLIQSGCSLTADRYIERYLGNNSICWEDNDHILIYASIAQYWYNQDVIGGPSKEYDWVGGEIWRITASTGVKELLFRGKESTYYDHGWPENMRMDISNGHIYVSNDLITYKVREDFSDWDSLGYFTLPNVSSDEKYLVGIDEDGDVKVKKYNLDNNTSEELYVNDELITWLDYDYERNYLLINSNKFVDLNTGEEVIVVNESTRIGKYLVASLYSVPMVNACILNDDILMDIYLVDTISNESNYKKIRVSFEDTTDKEVLENLNGVRSPNGYYYATSGGFVDSLGNRISTFEFPEDEL